MRPLAISGLQDRKVALVVGQSNSVHGQWLREELTNPLDRNEQKNVLFARHTHLNLNHPLEEDTTWRQLYCPDGPLTWPATAGLPTFGITQVLGRVISQSIANIAILQTSVGGTGSDYWATNYPSLYAPWIAARMAQLPGCTGALGVLYQGESDCINGTVAAWRGRWETIIAAHRVACANPTMPWIVVRIAPVVTLANIADMWAAQEAMVAADPYMHLVRDNDATSGAGPDIDAASVQRIGRIIGRKARELLAGIP